MLYTSFLTSPIIYHLRDRWWRRKFWVTVLKWLALTAKLNYNLHLQKATRVKYRGRAASERQSEDFRTILWDAVLGGLARLLDPNLCSNPRQDHNTGVESNSPLYYS